MQFYAVPKEEAELYHFGRKGQKWYQRLFQNKDGTLTALGKARRRAQYAERKRNLKKARQIKAEKKQAAIEKAKQEEAQKQAQAKREAEQQAEAKAREEAKQTILQKGSATDLMKYKSEFTTQELQTALNRLNVERQLSEYSAREIAAGQKKTKTVFDKANDLSNKVGTAINVANKMIDFYNVAAKVNNSFNKDTKLPTIDGKGPVDKAKKAAEDEISKIARSGDMQKIYDNWGSMTIQQQRDAKQSLDNLNQIKNKLKKEQEQNK